MRFGQHVSMMRLAQPQWADIKAGVRSKAKMFAPKRHLSSVMNPYLGISFPSAIHRLYLDNLFGEFQDLTKSSYMGPSSLALALTVL
jgi:hypothetical protein